jgi:MFS family permease
VVTILALFFLGSSASVQSLSFGLIKDIVPDNLFGTASGFNNMAAIIGGAISQPLIGFLLHWQWHGEIINHVRYYSERDYQIAFLLLPVAALTGLCVTIFKLQETHCVAKHQ